MIPRYENPEISAIWSNKNKLALWQRTELAVIHARENLCRIEPLVTETIQRILEANEIDIDWWLARDKEISHDLNAFIDERLRFLPIELQQYFHSGMTSYDTEEPAFASMLMASASMVADKIVAITETLKSMARKYRYTIMNGRTHGQEADLQSFGKRCLTWLVAINEDRDKLLAAMENLKYSRLSGAIGNYRGVDVRIERAALSLLGFKPFYGATQIMPRELYAPLAQSLCQTVMTLNKVATDIRLGARSGRPIYQEPFGKKQKGSSAMPHKKNTISCEQLEGMARLANGYTQMIVANINTWEERAIEQSSVERVAWPDLFHVTMHSIKTMDRVLGGLAVYPDNMVAEIINSSGCYAAGEAKEFLRNYGTKYGLAAEDAYRIVQLAAFIAFEPDEESEDVRQNPPESFEEAETLLALFREKKSTVPVSIQDIILNGRLKPSRQLDAAAETIKQWNDLLSEMFADEDIREEWYEIFTPSYLLKGEDALYIMILGDEIS